MDDHSLDSDFTTIDTVRHRELHDGESVLGEDCLGGRNMGSEGGVNVLVERIGGVCYDVTSAADCFGVGLSEFWRDVCAHVIFGW